MAKQKSIKLSIPTPCHENWNAMTPNEHGRHCDSCNKTVIDFSLFTDKQLVEFFNKTSSRICGNFNRFQLERELVYVEQRSNFLHKLLFGLAITAGFAGSANGYNNYNVNPLSEQGLRPTSPKSNALENEPDIASHHDTTHYIKGRLFNTATNTIIPNTELYIYGSKKVYKTDSLGNFMIQIPNKYLNTEIWIIVTDTHPGKSYSETSVPLSTMSFPILKDIEVSEYYDAIRGDVSEIIVDGVKK